jgi:acyl carrier protein phosphodiesterase
VNFLAHIYLSEGDDQITIGNFMADGIKGSSFKKFSIPLQKGIILHRAIDTFTDAHPIVRQSTKRLHSKYHHYSGIIVDILYDHFLAKNWSIYCEIPLAEFATDFYTLLKENQQKLTPPIQNMMPYMIADNWLLSYAQIEGIATVLRNMDRRTQHKSGMKNAIEDLKTYYSKFEAEFTLFFTDLQRFSAERLEEIHLQYDSKNG